jgi:uncharacterized membrane protein YdjX (TVP38/TMEM64 family)
MEQTKHYNKEVLAVVIITCAVVLEPLSLLLLCPGQIYGSVLLLVVVLAPATQSTGPAYLLAEQKVLQESRGIV